MDRGHRALGAIALHRSQLDQVPHVVQAPQ
jgi:hypothetical protein